MINFLEDKIKEITREEAVELFATEFGVNLEDYASDDGQYSSFDTVNFSCQSEVAAYGGEGQGEEYWKVSRVLDKRTNEVFFIQFDGHYTSWYGTDWSYNNWSIVRPQEVKVIKWF